jgi:hypothetical protein
MKTISIPEDLHKEIMKIRLENGEKNTALLIRKLVLLYKEKKFQEHSHKFRELIEKNGTSFEKLLKESRKIREEIADEWYPG